MALATRYSTDFRVADLIRRGVTTTLRCAMYRGGSLVVPVSGTVSVYDAAGTAIVTAAAVAVFEDYRIDWNGHFLFALGWLVLVLSIGAISLLNLLIRGGSAVNVASLFYLTPPTTALIAFFVFGENLTLTVALGMAVAVSGVYLVARAK